MATNAVLDGRSRPSYRGPSPILIGQVLGAVVAIVGLVVLIGWLLHLAALISVVPGWMSMRASTAVGFLLSGSALLLAANETASWTKPARLALGAAVLALGAAMLAANAFDRTDRHSVVAALNLTLVGAALLTLDTGTRWRVRPSESVSLAMGLLAFVALEGYVFGESSRHHGPAFPTLAPHTALCFFALAVGVFIVRPTAGLMRTIVADGEREEA